MITATSLRDWVEQYAETHDVSDATTTQYRRAIRSAELWSGVELTTATIDDRLLNQLLILMLRAGRSPAYAKSVKCGVLAVWGDAASVGLCDPPGRIRPIRQQQVARTVWTPEQVASLVQAGRETTGRFRGSAIQRSDFWETLLLVAWESGFRRRDLHRLRRCDLSEDFVWCQHKTKRLVRILLRPSTLARIDAWGRHPNATLWPLWGSSSAWDRAWKQLVTAAEIPYGPFKWIRKAAGTAAEAACPGAGHLLLGNTRAVFERHYLDATQVKPPRPPEIG